MRLQQQHTTFKWKFTYLLMFTHLCMCSFHTIYHKLELYSHFFFHGLQVLCNNCVFFNHFLSVHYCTRVCFTILSICVMFYCYFSSCLFESQFSIMFFIIEFPNKINTLLAGLYLWKINWSRELGIQWTLLNF